MKNKLFLLIIPLILLCGCQSNKSEESYYINDKYSIYVDKDTCVEYFVLNKLYGKDDIVVRYNNDGSMKTNKECIIMKEVDEEQNEIKKYK